MTLKYTIAFATFIITSTIAANVVHAQATAIASARIVSGTTHETSRIQTTKATVVAYSLFSSEGKPTLISIIIFD